MEPFHPNLIPVPCRNKEDISRLAAEMKQVCEADPDKEEVEYSKTETEAKVRSEMVKEDVISSGHLRFIHYRGHTVNVVLTLDEYTEPHRWNFSMSIATHQGPKRVPEEIADDIVDAFLGEGYQEIEAQGYWKAVRQFTVPK